MDTQTDSVITICLPKLLWGHKNFNFWTLSSFVGQFRPVFSVDIEIYEDKLGQSVDRIFSSHITKVNHAPVMNF